ncbi:hypothetical protein GCM10009647_000250 [Streptomyces sanglieri]
MGERGTESLDRAVGQVERVECPSQESLEVLLGCLVRIAQGAVSRPLPRVTCCVHNVVPGSDIVTGVQENVWRTQMVPGGSSELPYPTGESGAGALPAEGRGAGGGMS